MGEYSSVMNIPPDQLNIKSARELRSTNSYQELQNQLATSDRAVGLTIDLQRSKVQNTKVYKRLNDYWLTWIDIFTKSLTPPKL